ncbi:hypothetical protein HK098_004208 [Nowakowskiella sp. JEL0407]|nr:hypothetical protein HK098_004208 [Nowakowskiella sp. JEL0407]
MDLISEKFTEKSKQIQGLMNGRNELVKKLIDETESFNEIKQDILNQIQKDHELLKQIDSNLSAKLQDSMNSVETKIAEIINSAKSNSNTLDRKQKGTKREIVDSD